MPRKFEKVIIIGGKGAAVVIGEQIYDAQQKGTAVEFLGFAFDDKTFGSSINDFPILCGTREVMEKFGKHNDVKFIYQLYRPDLMVERTNLLKSYGIPEEKFFTFIHPSVMLARSAQIGYGCSILANCVVNPGVVIGNHCSIHSGSLVGHDTHIGENNFIAAHTVLGSNIKMGNRIFIGLNTTFNNYLDLGDDCFVAMGSNVIKSIPAEAKVRGNPAKVFQGSIKPL